MEDNSPPRDDGRKTPPLLDGRGREWRKLPRRHSDDLRCERIAVRVTITERDGLRALAAGAGMTISDWIITHSYLDWE